MKNISSQELVELLNKAGFLYKAAFVDGVVVDRVGKLIFESPLYFNIRDWAKKRFENHKTYLSLTKPYNEPSFNVHFVGTFTKENFLKQTMTVQRQGSAHLLPMLAYPHNCTGSIYEVASPNVQVLAFTKDINEIESYWILVIEELFSRVTSENITKYTVKNSLTYARENANSEWAITCELFSMYTAVKHIVDCVVMETDVLYCFPDNIEVVIVDNLSKDISMKVELVQLGNVIEVNSLKELNTFKGKFIYVLNAENFDTELSNAERYEKDNKDTYPFHYNISVNSKFRVTYS